MYTNAHVYMTSRQAIYNIYRVREGENRDVSEKCKAGNGSRWMIVFQKIMATIFFSSSFTDRCFFCSCCGCSRLRDCIPQ